MEHPQSTHAQDRRNLPFAELVALAAAIMALNALAIDMMLPALGTIGAELGAVKDNDRQLVVIVYIMANGVAQLFFGPLVDRFGRKRVLLWSLGGYILGSLMHVFATTFTLLLAARIFQGFATAGTRVAIVTIVRDQCSGRRMAQVMSLAITIFMAAPILAPGIGQIVLSFSPWRGIFVALLLYGAAIAIWVALRAPETLTVNNRKTLQIGPIMGGYWQYLRNRISFV